MKELDNTITEGLNGLFNLLNFYDKDSQQVKEIIDEEIKNLNGQD